MDPKHATASQCCEAFVGREVELSYLESAMGRAKAHGGRLVLLRGEKGVGKTRLVSEFATRAAAHGSRVLWGRWDQDRTGHAPPRFSLFEAGSQGAGQQLPLSQIAITPDDLSGLGSRIRTEFAASGLLAHSGDSHPLEVASESTLCAEPIVDGFRESLLVIDDLHPSDQLPPLLLSALIRELRATPSLIVGVYQGQEAEAPEEFDAIFRYLVDEVDSIELRGLSEAEVGRVMTAITGEPADASIIRSIYELSRGNPATVTQVLAIASLLRTHVERLIARPEISSINHATVDSSSSEDALLRENAALTDGRWLMREGDYWTVRLRGRVMRLRHLRGLTYIDYLAQRPGMPIHALELAALGQSIGDSDESRANHNPQFSEGLTLRHEQDDAGPMLDWRAKESYGRRLKELTEELDEATGFNDLGRTSALQEERALVMRELARSMGLRGRDRRGISSAERARVSVTHAIKSVIQRVRKEQPEVARLLSAAIRTGLYCTFVSESLAESSWHTSPSISGAAAAAMLAEAKLHS